MNEPADTPTSSARWKNDARWNQGKAEWALYDAERTIYGKARHYEATIYTNKQMMDPKTTTKAADWRAAGMTEVFKHNISEIIATENYQYRFLTTSFVRTEGLLPYKMVTTSQEDCGSSFRRFVMADDTVEAAQFCYFPDAGPSQATYRPLGTFAFHNALSLTLRDYPYGAVFITQPELTLVPDQRNNRETSLTAATATISDLGEETITVPYGTLRVHHLRVQHKKDGGVTESDFWFAADPNLLNVMVQYEGPHGTRYRLKKYGWWAYWDRSQPKPD